VRLEKLRDPTAVLVETNTIQLFIIVDMVYPLLITAWFAVAHGC
jgi:hypothetical protein